MEYRTDFIDTKELKVSDPKWSEGWHHNRKLKRINRGISLKAFGTFLQDRGYTHITMEYEGSGDSGDCFYAEGFKSKKDFDARGGKWNQGERIGGWGTYYIDTIAKDSKELSERGLCLYGDAYNYASVNGEVIKKAVNLINDFVKENNLRLDKE